MWNVVGKGRETVRQNLAAMAGCSGDEAAIVRNTTEALETVVFGLDLKKGNEVVLTKQDYPNMINWTGQLIPRVMISGNSKPWVPGSSHRSWPSALPLNSTK